VAAPIVAWTPNEAWLLLGLARRALIASLDGGPEGRAGAEEGARFRAEVHARGEEIAIELQLDAERASIALSPTGEGGHRWRSGWALVLERDGEQWTLVAGGPPVELDDARRAPLRAHLRVQQRAVIRAIDGGDELIPVSDAAFHRYTRQSTRGEPGPAGPLAPWMTPTEPEAHPWWEIDLGRSMFVITLCADLAAVPAGARVTIAAYPYPSPSGEPPPGIFERPLDPSARDDGGRLTAEITAGMVARYVRVTLRAPAGAVAALVVTAFEVIACSFFADTLRATLRRSFALHRDRPLFVARAAEGAPYEPTHTYGEVWSQAMALGRSLARLLEQDPEARTDGRVFLAVMTRNRPEWVMADLAAVERGYVLVPLSPDDPDERVARIFAQARPPCVICEARDVDRLAALGGSLRALVVCDAGDLDASLPDGPPRLRFEDLVREGASADAPPPEPRAGGDLYTLLFTSGSTGAPKGAMRSYGTFLAMLATYGIEQGTRHLSFQPLSHLSERMYMPVVLVQGATVAFSRGGAHLMDELRAFEPTQLGSVPRLYEVLYATYRRRLAAALAAAPDERRAAVEARELAAVRASFGGRLRSLSVGSAPVGAEVLAFLRRCFADIWVTEGYGSTEVGTIAVDGKIQAHVEVKLVPPPETPPQPLPKEGLGTEESREQRGVGDPRRAPDEPERGEIWVRTPHVISGYFGDPAATAASLDGEGFFATGDLGERAAGGSVRVVGRLRNTVKLAQGEFVSAERIEGALGAAPLVDRVYVHAAAGAPGVSALVVPQRDALAKLLGEPGDASLAELAAREGAPAAAVQALRAHGRRGGLAAWELPRGVLLEPSPFSLEDGLLTASGKLARGAVAARYGERLAALAAGEPAPAVEPAILDDGDLVVRVARVAARVLGREVDPRAPLGEAAGVDSLAAAEIMTALRDDLGREVPLSLWFEARSLEDLAVRLDGLAGPAPALADLAAADLAHASLPERSLEPPVLPLHTILLTGATGFLGAHLVEALLARTDLEILCLVRAGDDDGATARLHAALASYDIPAPPAGRVRAIAGDLGAPRLGLSEAAHRELEARADAVLHAGATVSWLASYPALRGPNVQGTLALLELASAGRARPFHFVSTISTAPADGDEDTVLGRGAALAGTPYGLSKWIAEEHVRRAGRAGRAGLPVAVYRPAMIAGHSLRGHGNPDDFVHRYLVGAAELGLYLDLDDARLDMTPVDFVAAAIVALVAERPLGGATHHLVNVDQSLSYAALGRALKAAGLAVAPATYEAFRAALDSARSSRLHALAAFFPERGFGLGMGPWPCGRTVAALAALGVARPAVDEVLVARYVASLRRRGLLPGG
jgi:fatty acid CoA ligase FadD9